MTSQLRVTFMVCMSLAFAIALGSCRNNGIVYLEKPVSMPELRAKSYSIKEITVQNDLDILFVIDNSGSMDSHQKNVIQNSSLFIDKLTSQNVMEWKIGLLSTSDYQDPYLGLAAGDELTYQDSDPVGRFNQAVAKLGTQGDSSEKSYSPILLALKKYPGFLRKGSILGVIIITDAEEQSNISTDDFIKELKNIKGDDRFFFYGVFAFEDINGCRGEGEKTWIESRYKELIDRRKGIQFSLCDLRFGENLAKIGKDLVSKMTRPRLYLQDRPVVNTIRVSYQGRVIPGGPLEVGGYWFYEMDTNSVVFYNLDFAPNDQENVSVSYEQDVGNLDQVP